MLTHRFRFPTTGVASGTGATLLAIDDVSLPLKHHVCYYLSKPNVRIEPVLTPSRDKPGAPDDLASHFYGTVLRDGGRFRMWYYGAHHGMNPDWPEALKPQLTGHTGKVFMGPVCYAESDDGLHWTKPNLGQVLFKGQRANNALALPNIRTAGAYVIKDDADPDPARRYKMVYNYYTAEAGATSTENAGAVRTAWSADGIRWTAGPRLTVESFLELACFYRYHGRYIMHGQKIAHWGPSEGGGDRGRQGYAQIAANFDAWRQEHVEAFALPDPGEPQARGVSGRYDQVHLGVGAAALGNVCVGLYGIWHNAHFDDAFKDISCDLGLVVSNDGLRFREPVKGHHFLNAAESPVTALPGKAYKNILIQANGILNVGDETRIYHGRWRNVEVRRETDRNVEDYYAEVALATLPRDRWGALGLFGQESLGAVISAPVELPSEGPVKLALNADHAALIRVEVLAEDFTPLPEYSGANAGKVHAVSGEGGLDCPVDWAPYSLSNLVGRTVRFRVVMKKTGEYEPRLYALNLAQGQTAMGAT